MVAKSVFRLHPENQSHEGIAEAGRRIAKARESAGDELDLGSLQITFVPESIVELKQLRTLTLNNNRLTFFPEIICELAD